MRVVLDDEQHRVAVLDRVAVVLDVLFARDGQDRAVSRGRVAGRRRGAVRGAVGAGVVQRQVEGEGAALARGRWRA